MALRFTQEEIEEALADSLPHGRRRDIARLSGLGESYLKRQFNPHDETPSCVFKTLLIACALDEIDPDQGDAFWSTIEKFRELSKQHRRGDRKSVKHGTGKLQKEIAELVMAALDELLDVENQVNELKRDMIAAFNASRNEPREYSARAN